MNNKRASDNIIEKLLKDERINRKEGNINSYGRYSYKKKPMKLYMWKHYN